MLLLHPGEPVFDLLAPLMDVVMDQKLSSLSPSGGATPVSQVMTENKSGAAGGVEKARF